MSEKNLYYLHELSDYKVASDYPDVRGWDIKDAGNTTIGKVDNLLVNKKTQRVVYLDVEVDESILQHDREPLATPASKGVHEFINKEGESHLIVPIGMVEIDEEKNLVFSKNIDNDTFRNTKRFNKGGEVEREYELTVYRQYVQSKSQDENTADDDFYNRKEFQSRYKNKQ